MLGWLDISRCQGTGVEHLQHPACTQRTCQFIDELTTPWNVPGFLHALVHWIRAVHPTAIAHSAAENFCGRHNDILFLRRVDCAMLA
jgi:hypothetical protein